MSRFKSKAPIPTVSVALKDMNVDTEKYTRLIDALHRHPLVFLFGNFSLRPEEGGDKKKKRCDEHHTWREIARQKSFLTKKCLMVVTCDRYKCRTVTNVFNIHQQQERLAPHRHDTRTAVAIVSDCASVFTRFFAAAKLA